MTLTTAKNQVYAPEARVAIRDEEWVVRRARLLEHGTAVDV